MNRSSFLFVSIAGLLSAQVFAGTMGPVAPKDSWNWVGSVSAGPVWARAGATQTFYLAPDIEKTYVAKKSSHALASGAFFAGIQKSLSAQWLGQLGLTVAATGNTRLQGLIWDDADPRFDNHSYQYKVRNTRVAVKGQLLLDKEGYWLIPWVSASVGVGFNRAHNFRNTALIFEALPNSNFNNHTKTAFAYTLGAGVQKALNKHWQIGVGYEFADWGKSELGRALGQTFNTRLALNHLYTNGVMFNITYLA